jgi:hypothetical protein
MRQPAFYSWTEKSGGMEASDAKRLKALEAESQELEKLLAALVMDSTALKGRPQNTSDARRVVSEARKRNNARRVPQRDPVPLIGTCL